MNLRSEKFRERWESSNLSFERDRSYGFSWPQRNYTCGFCKKHFKSAQALGGHMNVHRRERAKLRSEYSPPPSWDSSTPPNNLGFNPNLSPNISSSSSKSPASIFLPNFSYRSSLASFSSQSSDSTGDEKRLLQPHFLGVGQLRQKENLVRLDLDLGMGLLGDNAKEDLDLELRLGYV